MADKLNQKKKGDKEQNSQDMLIGERDSGKS